MCMCKSGAEKKMKRKKRKRKKGFFEGRAAQRRVFLFVFFGYLSPQSGLSLSLPFSFVTRVSPPAASRLPGAQWEEMGTLFCCIF